jgi:hypothetical protein
MMRGAMRLQIATTWTSMLQRSVDIRWRTKDRRARYFRLGQMEEKMMTKMLIPVVAVSLLAVTASASYARGGASAFAPGTSFHAMGSVAGHPGASGYAPGHLFRAHGSLRGHPGASGFAPGHRFAHRMR